MKKVLKIYLCLFIMFMPIIFFGQTVFQFDTIQSVEIIEIQTIINKITVCDCMDSIFYKKPLLSYPVIIQNQARCKDGDIINNNKKHRCKIVSLEEYAENNRLLEEGKEGNAGYLLNNDNLIITTNEITEENSINNTITNYTQEHINAILKRSLECDNLHKDFQCLLNYSIIHNDNYLLIIDINTYQNHGGATGGYITGRYFCFDIRTEQLLSFRDIINPDKMSEFNNLVQKKIYDEYNEYFEIPDLRPSYLYNEIKKGELNIYPDEWWYQNGELIFDYGGSYVKTIISIPITELKNIIYQHYNLFFNLK